MLLRIQGLRTEWLYLRARVALASAAGRERKRRLGIAEDLAGRIAKENMPWSNPFAMLIRAGLAQRGGDASRAAALLTQAVEGFEAADMSLYAMAARRRLGETLSGDRGRELIGQSDDWMRKQQIKNPSAFSNLLAPGFTEIGQE